MATLCHLPPALGAASLGLQHPTHCRAIGLGGTRETPSQGPCPGSVGPPATSPPSRPIHSGPTELPRDHGGSAPASPGLFHEQQPHHGHSPPQIIELCHQLGQQLPVAVAGHGAGECVRAE